MLKQLYPPSPPPLSRLGRWVALLRPILALLAPALAVLACQLVSQQSLSGALGWMAAHLGAAALTYVLTALLMLVLGGLTRLVGLGFLLSALLPLGLTLASYYKALINGEPLVLTDLSLAGQVGEVAGFAAGRMTLSPAILAACALVLLCALALTALDVLSLLGYDRRRPSLRVSLSAGGGCALALVLLLTLALPSFGTAQYTAYPMQGERDRAWGVPLSLLSAWYGSRAAASQDYGPERMARILGDMESALARQETAEVLPHIIFVMNESFFDINRLPGLTFSQDPLENYHRLRSQSTYGPFHTITCSGGTGWVEMEAFTAVAMEELSGGKANTELAGEVYEAMPSYVRVLQENGYRTVAFHSNDNTLYTRDKNYPRLGFDQVLFYEPYAAQATFAGGYFDDDSTADVLISLFEEDPDTPAYLYAMTMQNHQPYHDGRYDPERLEVDSPLLSQSELEMVECYVSGLYDADRMLGKLVDYISQVEEPVVLVFAGDHRPSLSDGSGETVYSSLGLVPTADSQGWDQEDFREMLSTDYLIWCNFSSGEGERPLGTTSLGAAVLEAAGVPASPFFAWLGQAAREVSPFHYRDMVIGPDGRLLSSEKAEAAAFLSDYQDVIYDLLYGEGYIAQRINRLDG